MTHRCKLARALPLSALAMMFAACGSSSSSAVSDGVKSVAELRSVVEGAGWQCPKGVHDDEAGTREALGQYGVATGSCDSGGFTIYESDAKRDELNSKPWNALKAGQCALDGRNWTAMGSQYMVEDLQKKLGGKGAKRCG